jgi:tRNA (cmo5U34)-methyltransferase
MATYRWNQHELAVAFDAAAHLIHPHYDALQVELIEAIRSLERSAPVVVDLGGGSGRFAARLLTELPAVRVIIVDQSAAFLEIAGPRIAPSGGLCLESRLQDDWSARLDTPPDAIVSMSAIHHLEADEKASLYRRCFEALTPGGLFLNADEVRPESPVDYLAQLQEWAAHMRQAMATGAISPPMCAALEKWRVRNIEQFDQPKQSGDDCHQTAAEQCALLQASGFSEVAVPWSKSLWSVLKGRKSSQA